MTCTIKINMDNNTFSNTDELSRILKILSDKFRDVILINNKTRLMDINGNNVGFCYIDKD